MESIIQSKKECFICRTNYDVTTTNELHEHHIFDEVTKSEKYGLKIWLFHRHTITEPSYSIHYQKALDLDLKKRAQIKFEETHSRKEFIEHFIKSYL